MQQLSSLHIDTASHGARSSLRRALRAVVALGLLSGSVGVSAAACSGDPVTPNPTPVVVSGTTTGDMSPVSPCIGGLILDGRCVAKCRPEKCLAGNTCVGNACVLKCAAHADCTTGTQDCLPAKEDDTGAAITVCTDTGRAGIGTSCPFNTECATVAACPDGKSCVLPPCGGAVCTLDSVACGSDPSCRVGTCPDKSPCVAPECGGATCTRDSVACGSDPHCRIGVCADEKPCVVPLEPNCTTEQCRPLKCQTAGAGDALAYCTKPDCTDDTQCPGGYYCGLNRDPHFICDLTPPKGNNGACGKTTEPCIDPATFGQDGNSYFEGSICLLRKQCVRRDECAACTSNFDCGVLGQTCVKSGAGMHCLRTCVKNSDCPDGTSCSAGSCQPLYASGCEGNGDFCAPCVDDEDCGSKGSHRACQLTDDLSGEKACLDLSFPFACLTDADCPLSPGNHAGHCLDDNDVLPTDSNFHKCYFPFKSDGQGGGKFTCGK